MGLQIAVEGWLTCVERGTVFRSKTGITDDTVVAVLSSLLALRMRHPGWPVLVIPPSPQFLVMQSQKPAKLRVFVKPRMR